MNLEIIKARCQATLAQVQKIKCKKSELNIIKNSPYYKTFSDDHEQQLDIKAKEVEINNEELILLGMLK